MSYRNSFRKRLFGGATRGRLHDPGRPQRRGSRQRAVSSLVLVLATVFALANGVPNIAEGASGVVHPDLSGHGHDGIASGSTFTDGRFGQALQFDGLDDHVRITNSATELDFTSSFTIEAWVRSENAPDAWARIAAKDRVGTPGTFVLWQDARDGRLSFILADTAGQWSRIFGPKLTPGFWTHVAGVYDATAQRFALYENGGLVAQAAAPPAVRSTPHLDLVIGAASTNGHNWQGAIDEVRVYDRPLNEREIRESYENGLVAAANSLQLRFSFDSADQASAPSAAAPVRLRTPADPRPGAIRGDTLPIRGAVGPTNVREFGYLLDGQEMPLYDLRTRLLLNFSHPIFDGTTTRFVDESGNGFDAVTDDDIVLREGEGETGRGIFLDGRDDGLQVEGTARQFATGGSFTLQAWIHMDAWQKVQTVGQRNRILAKDQLGATGTFILAILNGRVEFRVADPEGRWTVVLGEQRIRADIWTHVVAVYDAEARRVRVFQSAKLSAEAAAPARLRMTPNLDLTIGQATFGGQHFSGKIDGVRYLDGAATVAEVDQLYRSHVERDSAGGWLFRSDAPVAAPTASYAVYADLRSGERAESDTHVATRPGVQPDFTVWGLSDAHIQTNLDLTPPFRSLESAITDSLQGGSQGGPSFAWDIGVIAGDYTGRQQCPGDPDGQELVDQFMGAGVDPSLFYGVIGNHDNGEEDALWFQRWVDSLGESPEFSGVVNANRPFPVRGEWDHYAFEAGNVLFLMLGDKNFGGTPFGRECRGGFPAGQVSQETFEWWVEMVETNTDKIIVTVAHYSLFDTTSFTNFNGSSGDRTQNAPHGRHTWADARAGSFIYAIEGWTIDGLNSDQEFIGERTFGFKRYLEDNPGAIDLWLFGHTHFHQYPGKVFQGRADIEYRHGATFVNLGSVGISHGPAALPFSRLLEFEEGSDRLRLRTYLHRDRLNGTQGFYDREEKIISLRTPFVAP